MVLFGLNMVDELDRSAFGVLAPEIRDHFGLGTSGILTVISLSLVAALLLGVPIGFFADRFKRVPIAVVGACLWCFFSVLTGLAPVIWVLGIARAGSGLGRAVNDPVHNSLIADYYDIPTRPKVYAIHRYANALGQFVGPLVAGMLAYYVGWRLPFVVFSFVTAIFIVLALKLREPVRGHFERKAMGSSDDRGQHRGRAALLGGVVADHLAGPQPAAHLLRHALHRHRHRRPAGAERPLLRGRLQPRRAGTRPAGRHPRGRRPSSPAC